MKEYTTKPQQVSAYTFEEFVQYGIDTGAEVHDDGMPWSFNFYGVPITHENAERYIVSNSYFNMGEMIVIGERGSIGIYSLSDFEDRYDTVEDCE
jgi:hypothetical protein